MNSQLHSQQFSGQRLSLQYKNSGSQEPAQQPNQSGPNTHTARAESPEDELLEESEKYPHYRESFYQRRNPT